MEFTEFGNKSGKTAYHAGWPMFSGACKSEKKREKLKAKLQKKGAGAGLRVPVHGGMIL